MPSEKESKVTFRVPEGYEDEQVNMDTTGGKAQYYTYPYGAIFYLYFNDRATTEAQPVRDGGKRIMLPPAGGATRDGVDERGFYWKEVILENYRFGYRYVPVNMQPQFDRALHTVRIKKGGS